mmetsp:Transcript_10032/g.15034  ORF Transcript_10032/g.15034 Transcript_10032/m.15034 type:complete len:222 (+) Transcript_10032:1365-2030(+)
MLLSDRANHPRIAMMLLQAVAVANLLAPPVQSAAELLLLLLHCHHHHRHRHNHRSCHSSNYHHYEHHHIPHLFLHQRHHFEQHLYLYYDCNGNDRLIWMYLYLYCWGGIRSRMLFLFLFLLLLILIFLPVMVQLRMIWMLFLDEICYFAVVGQCCLHRHQRDWLLAFFLVKFFFIQVMRSLYMNMSMMDGWMDGLFFSSYGSENLETCTFLADGNSTLQYF